MSVICGNLRKFTYPAVFPHVLQFSSKYDPDKWLVKNASNHSLRWWASQMTALDAFCVKFKDTPPPKKLADPKDKVAVYAEQLTFAHLQYSLKKLVCLIRSKFKHLQKTDEYKSASEKVKKTLQGASVKLMELSNKIPEGTEKPKPEEKIKKFPMSVFKNQTPCKK